MDKFIVRAEWIESYEAVIEAVDGDEAEAKLVEAWENGELPCVHGEWVTKKIMRAV